MLTKRLTSLDEKLSPIGSLNWIGMRKRQPWHALVLDTCIFESQFARDERATSDLRSACTTKGKDEQDLADSVEFREFTSFKVERGQRHGRVSWSRGREGPQDDPSIRAETKPIQQAW